MTSPDNVEFKELDYEPMGTRIVSFKLSDDTIVKIEVNIDRVGVATNFKNPDGTAHYVVNTGFKLNIITKDRKFTIPRDKIVAGVPTPKLPQPFVT